MKTLTVDEFEKQGKKLFKKDRNKWRFRCFSCGNVQTPGDFEKLGLNPSMASISCIGRFDKTRGCAWTLVGNYGCNQKEIVDDEGNVTPVFNFDGEPYYRHQERRLKRLAEAMVK